MNSWYKALPIIALMALLSSCGKQPPLKTSFRQSSLDNSGLVLQVRNTGSHHLSCHLTARNKTLKQHVNYSFDLAPYSKTEIGLLETGWTFKTGESCEIRTEGFSTISFKVP